ncbi:MAG: hypothetical protein AB7S26_32980 [Sandaracinaceae bacterium]
MQRTVRSFSSRALRGAALALLLCGLASVAGCGGGSWSYSVVGTARDPGAEGTLQIERIEGGNRLVTASLSHLSPPARLGDGLTEVVMWFRDERGHSTKAGRVEYDEGSRTGRATATTPLTRFSVVITVERDFEVVEPSENVLFRQDVQTD